MDVAHPRKLRTPPRDVIRRLWAKVSKYRKTIPRLRKMQRKAPATLSEALECIRNYVTNEVFQPISCHAKMHSKGKEQRFPLWLKNLPCTCSFGACEPTAFCPRIWHCPRSAPWDVGWATLKWAPVLFLEYFPPYVPKQSWNDSDRVCFLIFDEVMLKQFCIWCDNWCSPGIYRWWKGKDIINSGQGTDFSFCLEFLESGFSQLPTHSSMRLLLSLLLAACF